MSPRLSPLGGRKTYVQFYNVSVTWQSSCVFFLFFFFFFPSKVSELVVMTPASWEDVSGCRSTPNTHLCFIQRPWNPYRALNFKVGQDLILKG